MQWNFFFQILFLLFLVSCQSVSLDREKEQLVDSSQEDLCQQGKIQAGLDRLMAEYHLDSKRPEYWNKIGSCHFLNKEMVKAKMYFQKSLQISSEQYAPALNNMGVIYLHEKQLGHAMENFQTAIKVGPQMSAPKINLALLYLKLGRSADSEKLLDAVYKEDTTNVDVLLALGGLKLSQGDLTTALKYFEKIPSKYHERPEVASHYALALAQAGRNEEAKKIMDGARGEDGWEKFGEPVLSFLE